MKRIISVITLIAVIFTIMPTSIAVGEDYQGTNIYKSLYNNVNFTDIANYWGRESIYKMGSLSIIRGTGENKFNPQGKLTREQALTLLVRLMGMEETAQTLGQDTIKDVDTGGHKILTSSDYWANGYIEAATQSNIITQDEIKAIENLSQGTKDTMDLEVEKAMGRYENNANLSTQQINNIRNQLTTKTEKRYTWEKAVSREQMAVWVARAMKLPEIMGQSQQMIYNLKDWQTIDTKNLPIIEAVLQRKVMEGDNKGYFSPKGSLTRGEAAKLFDNIHEELLKNQGYIINVGIVEKIDTTYQSIDNIRTENRGLRVKNDDNTLLNILTKETNNEVLNKGFIVIKDGKLLLPKDIKAYDYIKYYINPNGEAILVHILEDKPSEIEGFIEEVDIEEGFVSMKDYNDRSFKLKLSPGAKVTINDQWAEAKDLLYGQEVTAKLVNGNIIDIKGYLDIGEGGYIHPGERIYIGKVLYINQKDSKITIIEDDKEHEFIIEPYTPVIKDGSNIGLKGIKEGDIVRLEFDQYEGNIPMKAYVAEPDRQITNLYKATVEQFNAGRNELILGAVSYYDHTKWKSSSQSLKLPLGNDSEIYINGRKITKELLPSYLGREAYIATKDNYGKEETLKLVLKSGYEKNYYNSLQEIAFGDRKLKVDYNEVNFDDSTIIVKDGNLIHPYNLQEDDDIFLIAQGVDQYTAAFISIEGISDTGLIVYRGRIEEITQYGFELDNFDILEGTNWDYSSREREFNISEDTKIIDTRNDDIKEVSVDEFTNSRFLKDRYREDNYYDEYVYAVKYGDMVIAMDIASDREDAQVISISNIKEIDRENNIITLKELKDWNDFNSKWNINSSQIELSVEKTLFIKNGKSITINELSPSDSLYVLRRNDVGYIVIVR